MDLNWAYVGWGALGTIALFLFLLLSPLFLRKPQPTIPTQGAATATVAVASSGAPWGQWFTRWTIGGGIVTLAILAIILYFFWDKIPAGTGDTLATIAMVALGIFLFLKGGSIGKVLFIGILLLALIFGTRAVEALRTGQEKVSAVVLDGEPIFTPSNDTPTAPTITTSKTGMIKERKEAVWSVREDDGTIPVDTWSETITKPSEECKLSFPHGKSRRAQYQNGSSTWHDWVKGERDYITALRLKTTEKGVSKVTYGLRCPA